MATKGTCEDCGKEAILVRCLTCEKPPKLCTCAKDIKYRMTQYHPGDAQPNIRILTIEQLGAFSPINSGELDLLEMRDHVSFDTSQGDIEKFYIEKLGPKHICGKCYDRRIRQDPRTLSRPENPRSS